VPAKLCLLEKAAEIQQKLFCLNDHGGWGTCFHNLPHSSALQSSAFYGQCSGPQVVPAPTNGTIYHLQSLLRPDLQVCLRIAPDATASGFIVVLLPTLSLLL